MEKLPTLEKEQKEKFEFKTDIIKDKEGKVVDIEFVDKDKKLRLQEILPPDVKLNASKFFAFSYDPTIRTLTFDVNENINSLMARLGFLHETGHAIDFDKNPEIVGELIEHRDILQKIADIQLDIISSESYSKLLPEQKGEYLFRALSRGLKNSNVPKDKLSELIKIKARNERMGWAEALKLYRRIKKDKGLDILTGFKNKEIFELMNNALGNYEKVYRDLLPEHQAKLFLVKKYGGENKKEE